MIEAFKFLNGGYTIDAGLLFICPMAIAYSMGQITRSSSGDEIANINFLYDDIIHVLQNTIDAHKFHHRSTVFIATGSQASKQGEQQ